MMNRKFFKSRALLLPAIVLAATLGFTLSAQAQTCTIANWEGGPTNLSDANSGTQGSSNRRYGGPCGLRVAVDGMPRFLTDNLPTNENTYVARFYGFFNNAGSGQVQIFAADDGFEDQIQVWYDNGDIVLRVFDQGGTPVEIVEPSVGSGWHSIEFAWEAAASANIALSVDGAVDLTTTVDTSGIEIHNAHLGNVDGANTGGTMDFDDFDSRRASRPGRLLVGDADGNGSNGIGDAVALLTELNDLGFAAGQPDCDENGSIGIGDAVCLLNILNQ